MEKNESKITFKLENPKYVTVLYEGKEVGSMWSEMGNCLANRTFPYPSNDSCTDKVQICGFNTCSEVWGCGRYEGKKDLVVTFERFPDDDEYFNRARAEYDRYLKLKLERKEYDTITNFLDFCRYNIGQFDFRRR